MAATSSSTAKKKDDHEVANIKELQNFQVVIYFSKISRDIIRLDRPYSYGLAI